MDSATTRLVSLLKDIEKEIKSTGEKLDFYISKPLDQMTAAEAFQKGRYSELKIMERKIRVSLVKGRKFDK